MDEPDVPSTFGEQHPSSQDHQTWKVFWAKQGQEWRTEPEIDAERRAELAARRSITPDVAQGIYPFRGMKLSRADIEWLPATHEQGRGPVAYHDQSQRDRVGLDLRGADLSYARLQNLPLARTIGDVTWRTWTMLTEKQHLCWLHGISAPKMSVTDDATCSFTSSSTHQATGEKFHIRCLFPRFRTDIPCSQHT